MWLLRFMKSNSSSAKDSLESLRHFSGILDHATKIVTTLALLVALEIFRQRSQSYIVTSMYWMLWLFFFFYLQRLFEHCMFFMLENRSSVDVSTDSVRWVIGLATCILGVLLVRFGDAALNELVAIGFLQS